MNHLLISVFVDDELRFVNNISVYELLCTNYFSYIVLSYFMFLRIVLFLHFILLHLLVVKNLIFKGEPRNTFIGRILRSR